MDTFAPLVCSKPDDRRYEANSRKTNTFRRQTTQLALSAVVKCTTVNKNVFVTLASLPSVGKDHRQESITVPLVICAAGKTPPFPNRLFQASRLAGATETRWQQTTHSGAAQKSKGEMPLHLFSSSHILAFTVTLRLHNQRVQLVQREEQNECRGEEWVCFSRVTRVTESTLFHRCGHTCLVLASVRPASVHLSLVDVH